MNKVIIGDCREVLATLDENSVDSIVTDPPYGLSFMGKDWDHGVPGVEFWREALRVLKPGGHLLAFGGTRTYHRLACAVEDAGFDMRDMLAWVYGNGFPKSHNGEWGGTALKPAMEPITFARKPLIGTVEQNWREHGTGALNIDGCRIPTNEVLHIGSGGLLSHVRDGKLYPNGREGEASAERRYTERGGTNFAPKPGPRGGSPEGRWPANIIHDGSEDVLAAFPDAPGQSGPSSDNQRTRAHCYGALSHGGKQYVPRGDKGSAARFFYCAKATKKERANSKHPTIKPLSLIRYLVRLVTPLHGVSLDMFAGSGTHAEACVIEGFQYIAVEKDRGNLSDIKHRIRRAGRYEETEDDETEEKQPEQPSGSDQLALSL